MSQEIQPPDSLTNILPNLTSFIERLKKERTRNLRANEVFLQAKWILESDLAQTKKAEKLDLNDEVLTFRQTPPVTFTHLGQEVSIQIKDKVELSSLNGKEHAVKEEDEAIISIAVDGVNIKLFTLGQRPTSWHIPANSDLKIGLEYSIKDYNHREAELDQIESASQILTYIEKSLRSQSKLQSQPGEPGGGGEDL